jgi:hypothetical protein
MMALVAFVELAMSRPRRAVVLSSRTRRRLALELPWRGRHVLKSIDETSKNDQRTHSGDVPRNVEKDGVGVARLEPVGSGC